MYDIVVTKISDEKINELMVNGNLLLETAKQQGKISNQEQFQAVNEHLVKIKNYKKIIVDLFADPKKKAHEAHAAVCSTEKQLLAPAEQAEKQDSQMILDYSREQDQLAKLERERLQREAEAIAEAEKQAKLKEAEAAMDTGASVAEIQSLIEESETIIPVYIQLVSIPQAKPVGLTIRENWTFEITDDKQIPREYMIPNTVMLGQVAKAMKGTANIPGVRVYDAGSVAKAR
jgi:hypothetical protein